MSEASGNTQNAGGIYAYLLKVKAEHLIAGISGGVISTLVLHPLDLVKIRFQVNEGYNVVGKRPQYKGIFHALSSIAKADGFIGLYQGVTPNVWGAGISWGLYFSFYNSIKTWMQDGDSKKNIGPAKHILSAAEAGFATLVLTNPIWVTKTRLCLQYEGPGLPSHSSSPQYKGMVDALFKIYTSEGIRGLYKGFVPGLMGISHGALQFMVYEELKTQYNLRRHQDLDHRLTSMEYVTFAAISKLFAAVATYPYQVLRSRLQDQHSNHENLRDVVRKIIKYEGARGFYKGLAPNLLRVIPACAITFLVYEKSITVMSR